MNNQRVVTRFAPSPTGNLHIGAARTALFNFLYARANNGQFLLRIDDTDFARSSSVYTENIISSLLWLGIDWDNKGAEPYQSARTNLYQAAVEKLLESGKAYKCYATEEHDEDLKEIVNLNKKKIALRSFKETDKYTVRFCMEMTGELEMIDTTAGELTVKYENLDDFVLLRQDGSPTYMLASVVDDGEMGITNIIRGSEHLANTYRQIPLLEALGYQRPTYTHIPLIHNREGRKLSKRHDATSVHEYQQMGILPQALCNYMLRLGWGSGDTEIISMQEAQTIFNLRGLGASPAKFDMDKLLSLNAHYIRHSSDEALLELLDIPSRIVPEVRICLSNMKEKADSINYINDMSNKIFGPDVPHKFDQLPELNVEEKKFIQELGEDMESIDFSSADSIKVSLSELIQAKNLNKKNIFMFFRVALTGMKVSPGLFEVMLALGSGHCQHRLRHSIDSELE